MYPVDAVIGTPSVNAFAANTPVQQTLPRQAIYDEISIRVSGTLTNASYGTAPTKFIESSFNILGKVELSATGTISEAFKSCGFDWFCRQVQLLEGTAPYSVDVGTSNQAYPFEQLGKIYLRGAHWRNWQSTLLDSRLLSALTLTLNWRDQTAMVTGGSGGTSTLSSVQATVLARLWYGTKAGIVGFGHLRESEIFSTVTATQDDFTLTTLPVGNLIRRMEFKGMVGPVAFADPSDTLFNTARVGNNLHVRDGQVYPLATGYNEMRARNKSFYGIESMPAGHVLWEPSIHGTDAEQYDTRGKSELDAQVDVTYTGGNSNTLAIRTVEHVLPAAIAKAA